jgi:hypothetical protein
MRAVGPRLFLPQIDWFAVMTKQLHQVVSHHVISCQLRCSFLESSLKPIATTSNSLPTLKETLISSYQHA